MSAPWESDANHTKLSEHVAMSGVRPPSTPSSSGDDEQKDMTAESMATDAEGIWSPDIEQSFQEALAIYPPCGRRKIILSDEGKMYGRNELIARYIKLRTGKVRTRKQVSSHIQVLARKKQRELQLRLKETPINSEQEAIHAYLQSIPGMSSAEVVSSSSLLAQQNKPGPSGHVTAGVQGAVGGMGISHNVPVYGGSPESMPNLQNHTAPVPGNQAAVPTGFPNLSPSNVFIKQEARPGTWVPVGTHADISATRGHLGPGMYVSPPEEARKQPVAGPAGVPGSPYNSSVLYPAAMNAVTSPTHLQLLSPGGSTLPPPSLQPAAQPQNFTLTEFSAFLEYQFTSEKNRGVDKRLHRFVHILSGTNFSNRTLETVDIRQIADKFPGLAEMFAKGPQSAFFLIKVWANMDVPSQEDTGGFYGSTACYESIESVTCSCSTKVCSFGKQVVEKVETQHSTPENGRYVVRLVRSPMCEYMINFIHKLQALPERAMMNSVLENFTVLQLVVNRDTDELLMCVAFMFEVSMNEQGADHRIYRLIKE